MTAGKGLRQLRWVLLGRPPFAPFARALTRLASDRAAPPIFPSDTAMSPVVASAPISPCTLMLMSCSLSLML
jgi:hypothetical protein